MKIVTTILKNKIVIHIDNFEYLQLLHVIYIVLRFLSNEVFIFS